MEAFGELNDYIRYPSKWDEQEKNIYCLDDIASQNPHIKISIHTTLQAYSVLRIPEFLNWLKQSNFKTLHRFPYFVWVWEPEWLCPSVYPQNFRNEIADQILESLNTHEDFFLNYNDGVHYNYSCFTIKKLREFTEMLRKDSSQEQNLKLFVKETKAHDSLRNQSVTHVLPELREFFSDDLREGGTEK